MTSAARSLPRHPVSTSSFPARGVPTAEALVRRHVHGAELACREWGRPGHPLVLMVHGLSANALSAETLGRALAAKGYHVVAPDLRGRNLSPATEPGSLGWRTHAHDMLAVARQVNGSKPFTVVGHSMGAYVAMEMAVLARHKLERVVLIDGLGHIEPGAWKAVVASPGRLGKEYASADAYVGALLAKGIPPAWARSFREDLVTLANGKVTPRTNRDAVLEDLMYTQRQLERPGAFARHYWRTLPDATLLVRAPVPLVPQLGNIVSERDVRNFKAQRPRVRVVEAPGTNHYSVFTDAAVAKIVVAFVKKTDTQTLVGQPSR
ncbi:MAG: alpha/beta hydrolase [Myxococcota bacterium]